MSCYYGVIEKLFPYSTTKLKIFKCIRIATTNQTVLSARARDSRHRFIARDPF